MEKWQDGNIYVLDITLQELERTMNADVAVETMLSAEFKESLEFFEDSVRVLIQTPTDRGLLVVVANPTTDDLHVLVHLAQQYSPLIQSLYLMSEIQNLKYGELDDNQAKQKAQKFAHVLHKMYNGSFFSVDDSNYILTEYATLSNVLSDVYAKKDANVFRYGHYYTKSCSSEFSRKPAKMSYAFLSEHAKSLGKVSEIRSVFV